MSTNDIQQTSTPDADNCGALRTKSGQDEPEHSPGLTFPEAWDIQHSVGPSLDHDPKCSSVPGHHPLSGHHLLCDCGAIEREWKRRHTEPVDVIPPTATMHVEAMESGKTIIGGRRAGKTEAMRMMVARDTTPPAPVDVPETITVGRTVGKSWVGTPPAERPTHASLDPMMERALRAERRLGEALALAESNGKLAHDAAIELREAREASSAWLKATKEAREQRDRLVAFVENLVDAGGPHADIDGSSVVPAAYQILASVKETTIAGFNIIADPTLPPGTGEIRDPKTGEVIAGIKVGMNTTDQPPQ